MWLCELIAILSSFFYNGIVNGIAAYYNALCQRLRKAGTVKGDSKQMEELDRNRGVSPAIKLMLAGEKPFFGPGTINLFLQIDRLGSVRRACEATGISYSKGWKMISRAEKALNCRLVDRQQGGKNGGAAALNVTCREVIRRYKELEASVREYARSEYEKVFGDISFS